MADEYIDKVEVGAKIQMMYIRREMDYGGENDFCRGMRKALRIIENMPAADVQPIRHGRWIITDDVEHFIAVCSECGRTEDSRGIKDMPYCHCGAKMDIIYEDDKIRAIKVTGWDNDARNLTDEETEAETID